MSNIFFHYPPLSGLYEKWRHDPIEYGAAALLQNLVILCFRIENNFCPTFEQPPDAGARRNFRIDVLIYDYSPLYSSPGSLIPRLLVEIKGGGGSSREVEDQALANARASIAQYSLLGLFVQTVIGIERSLCFRFWWVDPVNLSLLPLDNGPQSGSRKGRSAYVDLNTDNGNLLESYYDQVKNGMPILPTAVSDQDQLDPLAQSQLNQFAQDLDQSANDLPNETSDANFQGYEEDEMLVDTEQGQLSEPEPEETDPEAGAGPSQAQGASQSRRTTSSNAHRIEIVYEPHTFSSDKFIFKKHKKGRSHITELKDWDKQRTRDGEVWTWKADRKYWGYKPRNMERH
ncbi:hypothetical protein CABS01_16815 [Colletotrichum abscissum]|uniref:uncharacterized protein n=1 Tax=Colletotrichum abscissum TaxID=1671311 RepID=UPI0027D6040A|nr:uncharacterized protein CABS01_16815 [Colletotrichum abscissum]KAK1510596.1 hypothetical protein CABS01_16815 [Colletotrichum abscissum]